MFQQPIELGPADELLAEGRLRAAKEQIPFMAALKAVVIEKLKSIEAENKGNKSNFSAGETR